MAPSNMYNGSFWISDRAESIAPQPLQTARSMVDELTQQLLQTEYHIVCDDDLDAMRFCDDNLDAMQYTYNIKEGERNMNNKIVDLYYERRKESIREDFKAMLEEEYNNNPAVKEYNELVGTFEASLAELANRYNTEEETVLIKSGYKGEYGYVLNESLKTKLTGDLKASYDAEIKDLELLIEEVRAMLSFSDNEEHRMDVLKKYEIVDKKGKLDV